MRYEGWLSFRRIICMRCGDARVVGIPCPTCGFLADEREVDPDRQRRQRVSSQALEALNAAGPPGVPLRPEPEGIWDRLGDLLETFLASLLEEIARPGDGAKLTAAIMALRQIEADVEATPRLRPWVETWRSIAEVLARLHRVAKGFLSAAAAESPLEAQQAARAAQLELDHAADPASELSDRLERLTRQLDADTPEETLIGQAQSASESSGASALLEVDELGAHIYQRISGMSEAPSGLGLVLGLLLAGSVGQFDDDRLWLVAERGYGVLSRDPERLRAILDSPSWASDIDAAAISQFDAGIAQDAAFRAARNERQALRALMDVGHSLVEIRGKSVLATLLCVTKGKTTDYERVRAEDAGALLQRVAQDRNLSPLVEGLDRAVRVAKAHEDFAIEGDEIILSPRRNAERLSTAQLVDRLLAGVESVTGLELALLCAATEVGFPLERFEALKGMGLDPLTPIHLLLASAGWSDVSIDVDGASLRIACQATVEPRSLHVIAPLVSFAPDDIADVELVIEGSGWRHVQGPTEPYIKALHDKDELSKLCYYVEGFRRWTADARPLVDGDYVRKWVAILAGQAIESASNKNLAGAIKTVRRLRQLARNVDDAELEQVLDGVIEAMPTQALGMPPAFGLSARMATLASYLTLRGTSLLD